MIRLLPRRPVAAIVEQGAGLLDDVADMRFAGDILFRQSPERAIGRVMQLQAAIAAIDGDGFEEMVEGGPLHLGQRVAGAFERQAVGDILVDEGQPAERMRRDGQPQGAAVGQVHADPAAARSPR